MAIYVTHTDNEPLATGTHKGADGSTYLYNPDAHFNICGVVAGLAIYKDVVGVTEKVYLIDHLGNRVVDEDGNYIVLIDGSYAENGLVTSATQDTVTASGITSWQNGDTYLIYKTEVKDSYISYIATDRIRGRKILSRAELNSYGYLLEDTLIDLDENGRRLPRKEIPFGPGQPERLKRRG